MPNRNAKFGDVVSYRNAAGETTDVVVIGAQKAAPANTGYTLTASASGGTLATATYSYRISIIDQGVESPASTAKTVAVTGPTGQVTIDATVLIALYPTATQWKLFGRVGASEALIATTAVGTPTFVDTGSVSPSGAVKTADGSIRFRNFGTVAVQAQVAAATTTKGTDVYFNR